MLIPISTIFTTRSQHEGESQPHGRKHVNSDIESDDDQLLSIKKPTVIASSSIAPKRRKVYQALSCN